MGVDIKLHPKMANEAFKLKSSLKFQLEKRNKDGVAISENLPIQMVITFNGQRLKLYAGYRIDISKWDVETERVRKGCNNIKKETYSDINKHLSKLNNVMTDFFTSHEFKKIAPTLEDLKAAFQNAQGKQDKIKAKSFFDVFTLFMAEQGKESDWTIATKSKFTTVYNTLFEFNPKLKFTDIDNKVLQSYVDHLRVERKYRNTTIAKQLKFIRWFLRWAIKEKHSTNTEFQNYKPKLKGTQGDNDTLIFLTWKELTHLYNLEIEKNYLRQVRDVFCFCSFSGLRYSDAFNLSKSDIKDGHIRITTQKTTDTLTIQLNKYSKAILDKYVDINFKDEKVLPVISNQKMNKYLKELCKLAGFDTPEKLVYYMGNERIEVTEPKYKLIGTHTARRTFICNAIAMGIPVEVLIKWTGHKDFKAMSPYLKVMEELKTSEMNKFNR